jgi:capsule biosynthesis phosphatase
MIRRDKCIVMDVDGTLCPKKRADEAYCDVTPNADVVARLREYRAAGFYVILATSRNMNTYDGNVGLITANTAKTLLAWLDAHDIPYDELHVGKPWGGKGGFYVDDKAIRPDEFLKLSYAEVLALVGGED